MGYLIEESGCPDTERLLGTMFERFRVAHTRTDSIHATDTLLCMRKAYWDKVNPLDPTPEESMYFLLGLGLQKALYGDTENSLKVNGVMYSPDAVSIDGCPIELKTTRMSAKNLREKWPPKHWLDQIAAYCYALGVHTGLDITTGYLMVIPVIKPEVLTLTIRFNDSHIAGVGQMVEDRGLMLTNAIFKKAVPPMVDASGRWECKNCRYYVRCNATGETSWAQTVPKIASVREDFAKYR